MELVFATHNKNKLKEIKAILPSYISLLSLTDINCHDEIPETGDTIEENSLIKAKYVKEKFGYDCFADDTGLLVEELNGAPGVYSARYAGEQKNSADNINKLLSELNDKTNRNAHFKTVITLVKGTKTLQFTGECHGEITIEIKGNNGFGYDPVFTPDDFTKTFAEISLKDKNKVSHRGKAFSKLYTYLNTVK